LLTFNVFAADKSCIELLNNDSSKLFSSKIWDSARGGQIQIGGHQNSLLQDPNAWTQISFGRLKGLAVNNWYVKAILNSNGVRKKIVGTLHVELMTLEVSTYPSGYLYHIQSLDGQRHEIDEGLRSIEMIRGFDQKTYFNKKFGMARVIEASTEHFVRTGIMSGQFSSSWDSVQAAFIVPGVPALERLTGFNILGALSELDVMDAPIKGLQLNGLRAGLYNGTSIIEGVLEVNHIFNNDSNPIGEEYFLRLDTGERIQLLVSDLIGFRVLR